MYYLTTKSEFDSAHFLLGHGGKCSNIHGHRWEIVAKICKQDLEQNGQSRGMIIDFSDFKKEVRKLADFFDHKLVIEELSLKPKTLEALNEEGFSIITLPFRPTAENLAKYFFDKLKEVKMPIYSVEIYETPNNCAIYKENYEV